MNNKNIPLLFVAGKEDPSVAFGKLVLKVVKLYKECGMKQVSYKIKKISCLEGKD